MKISNRELRIANLARLHTREFKAFRRFAIRNLRFAILLLLVAVPVIAQTNKVTVTLVRWPYT
jgi:hypothetical protein